MIVAFLSATLSAAAAAAQASPIPQSAPPVAAQPAGPAAEGWPHGGPGNRRALFISPMGQPFRGQATRDAGLQAWFVQADKDHNGSISAQEMQDDAARFFATLDSGHDHEIDPDDINHYENEMVPEIRMGFGPDMGFRSDRGDDSAAGGGGHRGGGGHGGGGRRGGGDSGETEHVSRGANAGDEGLQGAGRFGLLNNPEPVIAADSDFNRGVSLAEFQTAAAARFALLDTNRDGKLSLDELQARMPTLPAVRLSGHSRRPADAGGN